MLDDIFAKMERPASSQIEVGTVGWDDRGEWFEHGKDFDDGFTLVYVTLYRGRSIADRPKAGVAGGYKIKCHISDGLLRMPKKGARVYVAIPSGMEEADGAGVIVASVSPSKRTDQFEADRVVLDFGDDMHVVIRGRSVSLSDHENRFMGVGTPRAGGDPGLLFQAADGSGGVIQEGVVSWFVASGGDAKTVLQMTPDAAELLQKSSGFLRLKEKLSTFSNGPASFIAPSTQIGSGTNPTALKPVATTAAGAIVSASVFVETP